MTCRILFMGPDLAAPTIRPQLNASQGFHRALNRARHIDPSKNPPLAIQSRGSCRTFSSKPIIRLEPYSLLINDNSNGIIEGLTQAEVQMYPTSLELDDGTLENFTMLRPLQEKACVDFIRSDVHFDDNLKKFSFFKSLVFTENPLDGLSVAREKHSGLFIISDAFYRTLGKYGASRVFLRPEDHPNAGWY